MFVLSCMSFLFTSLGEERANRLASCLSLPSVDAPTGSLLFSISEGDCGLLSHFLNFI